jgi:hypothetical protein
MEYVYSSPNPMGRGPVTDLLSHNAVYRIESISANKVHTICVYGRAKGGVRGFEADDVSRSMINNNASQIIMTTFKGLLEYKS